MAAGQNRRGADDADRSDDDLRYATGARLTALLYFATGGGGTICSDAGAARTDEDAQAQRGDKSRVREGRAGWAGDHLEADVRPAVRVCERQHVLRDLRRGADGASARGRDRHGQEARRQGLRADGGPQDGRLRGGAGRLARQTADRADQTRPGRDAQDAREETEEEVAHAPLPDPLPCGERGLVT